MGRLGAGAGRAFFGVGRQGRVAGGAGGFVGLVLGAVVTPGALLLKTLQQTQGLGVVRLPHRVAREALGAGRLVPVLAQALVPEPVPVHAVFSPALRQAPRLRVCIAHWVDWFGGVD